MKILKYSVLTVVILCAFTSALTTKIPGVIGWVWQLTTILWVVVYGISSMVNEINDELIIKYKELTEHLLNRIEQLKEELRQTQIQGKSVTRKK